MTDHILHSPKLHRRFSELSSDQFAATHGEDCQKFQESLLKICYKLIKLFITEPF